MALNHNWDKGWAQLNLQGFVGLSSLSNSGAHVTLYQLNYKVWEWVLGLRIFYSAPVIQCAAKFGTKALALYFTSDAVSDTLGLPFLPSVILPFPLLPCTSSLNQPCFSCVHSHPSSLRLGVTCTFTSGWMSLPESMPFHTLSHQSLSIFTCHIIIKTVSFVKNMFYSSLDHLLNAGHIIDTKHM